MNFDKNTLQGSISRSLYSMIVLVVVICSVGLFFSISGGDASSYSVIAKNIVVNHDWIDLAFDNAPWLDKPHFPFWMTALSYKLFGIHPAAYILPGFLFYLLGAFYTYRLAKKLYFSNNIGLLASLVYLSSFFLIYSAINVEAEAYLLGEIIPACYYWYGYYKKGNLIQVTLLLKGAFFTALAMMTKGIFVLCPIFSGVFALLCYEKKINLFEIKKWSIAIILSLLLIFPELISLYLQFDAHPTLVVFGHTHVSGIKFYFWDSQFGRFFNTGPITKNMSTSIDVSHYFYYLIVLLWAFLPWSLLFFVVLCAKKYLRHYKNQSRYLLYSFFPIFIVFSITRFQFDHYINILLPFAAILIAGYIFFETVCKEKWLWKLQNSITFFLAFLLLMLSGGVVFNWHKMQQYAAFDHFLFFWWCFLGFAAAAFLLLLLSIFLFRKSFFISVLFGNVSVILLAAFFILMANELSFRLYDKGYNAAQYITMQAPLPVLDDTHSNAIQFYLSHDYPFKEVISGKTLGSAGKNAYYITAESSFVSMQKRLEKKWRITVLRRMWVLHSRHLSGTLLSLMSPAYVKKNLKVVLICRLSK